MKMRKTVLNTGLALVLGSTGMAAHAAMVQSGDLLTISAGMPVYDGYGNQINVGSGSYFVCDCNGDSKIQNAEKTAMAPGSDGGIIIGSSQAPGEIDAPWLFFGNSGGHYTTVPVTGGTTAGLNFSGWHRYWNSVSTALNTGAWTPLNCGAAGVSCAGYANGLAIFNWSGVYGDAYTLDYTATVPIGDASGFDGVRYFLHLEGIVQAVPIPAAAWLLASGLFGLLGVTRRK